MNLSDIHKVELKEEYFKRPKALLAANKKSIENQKVFQKRKQLENSFAYFQSLYWWYFVRGVSNVSSRSKWYQSQGHGLFLHIPNSHCSYVTSMSHLPSKKPKLLGLKMMMGIFIILVTFYNGRKMCEESSSCVIKSSFLGSYPVQYIHESKTKKVRKDELYCKFFYTWVTLILKHLN